ncbi:BFD-like (2Fe-2S) protein [Marinifilum sp. JC120]|nr:BFD-like (2Fe-2S) protein [Marinifilum sp. JC120]
MSQLICHCFGYTSEDIASDVLKNGKSTIFERIMKEKQNGRCHCAIQNPKGR